MKLFDREYLRRKIKEYKRDPFSFVLLAAVCLAAFVTMLALLFVIVYILVKGIPHLTPELFS